MRIRRLASVAAIMVAIVVAITLPVSQLRTRYVATTCCCPDPSHCHCPDHKADADRSKAPAIRACHKEAHEVVSPQPPPVAAPVVASAPVRTRVTVAIATAIPAPHAAPSPRRPDAPS